VFGDIGFSIHHLQAIDVTAHSMGVSILLHYRLALCIASFNINSVTQLNINLDTKPNANPIPNPHYIDLENTATATSPGQPG